MKTYECVEIFHALTLDELKLLFNGWVKGKVTLHTETSILKNTPFQIVSREFKVLTLDKDTLEYFLVVHYVNCELEAKDAGPDRGAKVAGASAFHPQRQRT